MTTSTLENCLFFAFLMMQIWDINCKTAGYTISVPEEVTAQAGLCVRIPCSFTVASTVTISKSAVGIWYREKWYGHEFVTWNKYSSEGRMFFTGDVSSGDCSLFINDIQESDENRYYFRLEDTENYSYMQIKPYLKVTGLTDKPEISVGKLVAGEKATITCKSPGVCAGSPPAITWNRKHGEKITINSYQNRTTIYFSNLTFTPSKGDNGSPLTCMVAFPQSMAVTEQMINLNVEYPPDVLITIGEPFTRSLPPRSAHTSSPASAINDTFIVKEGDSRMVNCTVDSNPLAEIAWFVGGELKKGPTNGSTLLYSINNISLSDAGKYLCTGRNDHRISTKTIEIIVHYSPRPPNIICTTEDCIIDKQDVIYVSENSTLSLLCTAESLPEASLSWRISGPSTSRSGVNGHLTLHNVSLRDEGQFACVASNSYGKSVALANITVTYEPRTVVGRNSSCWEHGGHLKCECLIQSSPTANIEWDVNEQLYASNHSDKELNILTVTVNAVTNSTLILTSSWMNTRTVRCMSANKHGRLELLLFEGYGIGIIAAVSCVTVVVLLLIGGFVVMHHIRKKKMAMKPEDKKEINADDCSVIYSNSEVHIYGNQVTRIGTGSVDSLQDDSDTCSYMNIEDVEYTTINFSKLEAKNAVENDEIEYAEVKK